MSRPFRPHPCLLSLNRKDSPESTPNAVSTIQPSSTASAAPEGSSSSNQNKSNAGAIAGAVVGGVVGTALLIALILWYRRRWRLRAQPRPSPFTEKDQAFNLSDPDTDVSIGKYYVRAIACWHTVFYFCLF